LSQLPTAPIQNQEWYQSLVDDCQTIFVEGVFNAKWTLIETYHGVGSRIIAETASFERANIYGQNIVQDLAQAIGKSTRTVHYAIALATQYPDLNDLPEGKNISMNRLITKYLTAPKDVPARPATYYNGLATLTRQRQGGWSLVLPADANIEAEAGDQVHIVIREGP